jgi:hypothetical protein
VAEQILIELIVDDSQLQPAIDLLEKTGQIDSKLANGFRQTTAEINKQAQAIKADAAATAPLKKNLEDINKVTKNVSQSFMQGFQEGVIDTLKEAGVSVKEFTDALGTGATEVSAPTESLRTRLKNLTAQIAELKLSGQDNTEQFKKLVIEAGRVKDAMADAGQEIQNVASDTGTFDGIISGLQGVTGAAQIGQGVTALFGEESEELQKTLLRVNAVMAIGQGLQQVQNVLQKESAASRLADTIAAKAQIVVQRIYTAVTGQATAATTAFKVALATTGIGLLVVGILALVQALNEQDDALEDVNSELERNKALIDADTASIERRTEIAVAEAQKAGKAESDITRIRGKALQEQKRVLEESNARLLEQQKLVQNGTEEFFKLNDAIDANNEAVKNLDNKILIEFLNLQKQSAEEAKKANEEAKKAAEERAAKAREARLRELNDQLALLERQLLVAEEGGEEELRLKQRIVRQKALIELEGENLTKNQRKLIQEKSAQEELELERDRNKRLTAEAIAGQISRNNAVLSSIQTSDEDRLSLQISNIELAAQAEINAAENNAAKIKEIIAKRDADIAGLRKTFIDDEAQNEIDLLTAREGENNRALQRLAADEKQSVRTRITALQQLANFDFQLLERREQALEDQLANGLISEQEYNHKYEKLQDEKAKVAEDTEKKITGLHQSEAEKRKQINEQLIQSAIEVSQQVVDILGQLADLQTERDQQRLEGERAKVEELLESGAITEKEAIARNKRIDAEEKKLKREAAQRDKNIAIFNAVINTAAAITKALPNLILAGIAAALGAAQIGIIAARPIPKFKGGKKNRYEGPGIIGEAGSEIFEHNGKRYIAHGETLVWLGKDDKVYTPQETRRMLPRVDRELMKSQDKETVVVNGIDYDALGKAVGKHVKVPGVTVDENGFKVWQQEGMSRTNYMNKYYRSPR